MTVRGENQWPYTGTSNGRSRGELPAAYGEFLMAAVRLGGLLFRAVWTAVDGCGHSLEIYGSGGWGFESLRACQQNSRTSL